MQYVALYVKPLIFQAVLCITQVPPLPGGNTNNIGTQKIDFEKINYFPRRL